jgi:hypothetical protein
MSDGPEIRQRMEVVGSDGQHVGTVDRLERGQIKLTREDDLGRAGEHRLIPLGLVAVCEANQVRLTLRGQEARALAIGGLDPWEVVEDSTVPVGGGEGSGRTAGTGAGVPDDGGTCGMRGGVGTAGVAHGHGTGGGGTSSQATSAAAAASRRPQHGPGRGKGLDSPS